jgi:poly(3-hydroxybutyrate) depolymerase
MKSLLARHPILLKTMRLLIKYKNGVIMKSISKVGLLFFFLVLTIGCHKQPAQDVKNESIESLVKTGAGSFDYKDAKGKPITVWYFAPPVIHPDTLVQFVLHGAERNGKTYRDQWIKHAETLKCLLLVPEFSNKHYPGDDQYILGNMFSAPGIRNERSEWSFTTIENIFDYVKAHTTIKSNTYNIYGHSAGAQFVHRMLLFSPDARIKTAVAANSGWYTLPTYVKKFPYGLTGTDLTNDETGRAFSKNLIVLLGEKDTEQDSKNLRNTSEAMEQGKHRFARGQTFYSASMQSAAILNVPFNWQLKTVPGAGHNNSEMAKAAVVLLNQ